MVARYPRNGLLPSIAVSAVVVMVAAACLGPTSAPASAPPASSASAPAASSGATGTGTLCAANAEPCDLAAGTYSAAPFSPAFTFTLPDAWSNDRAYADGGGVSQGSGTLDWAAAPTIVKAGQTQSSSASADEFLAYLAALPGVTATAPVAATVGGVEGRAVDVTTNTGDFDGLYEINEDAFNLGSGEKARFIVLEQGGQTLVFVQEALQAADFDAWLDKTQPILDGLTWEP